MRDITVKTGSKGLLSSGSVTIPDRPELKDYVKINGDLDFVFRGLVSGPRIVVETKKPGFYEVVCHAYDDEAINVVAKALGLVVEKNKRVVPAIAMTESKGGHRLKGVPAPKEPFDLDKIAMRILDLWVLDSATLDELAAFLEQRFRRTVVNKTGIKGHWRVELSHKASRMMPYEEQVLPLGETGLNLKWEDEELVVTVVKDPS